MNPYKLLKAKSCLYICIKYIGFGLVLVGFYGISNIVDYLMWTLISYLKPNPVYTNILNIYDLVWLGFTAYEPL